MDRSTSLLQIRPIIGIQNNQDTSVSEVFQNEVLRPILKFQHALLCFTFLKDPSILKSNFPEKHEDQKTRIIVDALKSNHKLKSHIIHSITSLMTMEELERFHINKSEYQKRIISMASQRLVDGLIEK